MTRPVIGITSNEKPVAKDLPIIHLSVNRQFADGVKAAGGLPFYIPLSDPKEAKDYIAQIDKLILSGGQNVDPKRYGEEKTIDSEDYFPERDRWEAALIEEAIRQDKPVLGICRGLQLYNVVTGGSLYQDIAGHKGQPPFALAHDVVTEPNSQLRQIYGDRQAVNSVHQQSLKKLAPHLAVTAKSADDAIIEGVESQEGHAFIGVQWHPEFLIDKSGLADQALFTYFVQNFH
ncbi:gamma-glutamyl-gamma-aminobutyrate hydrolase family protein [Streptococcus sp. DD12]|uniref:gamma-glutamyl-gamma-aminobutyrate hydrolase family protein n=1 Tax=Streptococcus sp. DD12 TaxID=1777880 RepID=UPI0007933829|nr:gamma-glutamyl-gamma-aminobutyrate hydrolase family protein [Streptococcus sp. DD12]KXT76920.1 Glutamine amidotransferase, class I [Streptococcus sp. DD12]